MSNNSNWSQMFKNPYSIGLRRIFAQYLKQDYVQYEDIIERMTNNIQTDKDYQDFGGLIISLYETAYKQCIEEHKEILEKHGIEVKMSSKEVK